MKIHAIICAFFLLVTTGTLTAQTGKIEIGAQGGPSFIALRGNEFIEKFHEVGLGFSGGLFLQYNLHKNFSLRLDPAFERKGSQVRFDATDGSGNISNITVNQYLDYITVPLLAHASVGDRYKLFANAGPYVAFLMGTTQVVRNNNLPEGMFSPGPVYLKDVDLGLTAGVGVSAGLTENIRLSAELRNNLGLRDISNGPVVGDGKIQTNSVNVLIGIAYTL